MTRRRSRSDRRGRGGQVVKAALFSLAGIGLAWLVVRSAAVYALIDSNPYAVSAIAPDDPRVAMNIATIEYLLRNGAVPERTRDRAYAALRGEPLSETPMLLAATQALAAGDYAKGQRLLEEARRREPRYRAARLLLLDRYLRTGQIAKAGIEIAALNRLIPEATDVLVPQLAAMATDPKTGPVLMDVLRRDPPLQQAVLTRLAATLSDPDQVLAAARHAVPADGESHQEWQHILLSRLIDKGDYQRAYRLWLGFAGRPAAEEKSVYDGRFADPGAEPPFNWQLSTGGGGVAERASGPSLQAQYFGRDPLDLASQLLLLRPGSYRLRMTVEGDAKGEGTKLVWTIGCAKANSALAELPLVNVTSARRAVAVQFTVPQGCPAQWLRLSGRPADVPNEQDATIRDLAIERVGG